MSVALDPNHQAEMEANILQQFKGLPNIKAVVDALAAEVQALEVAAIAVLATRVIGTAQGPFLDVLGKLVGAPTRQELGILETDDADFRVVIQCQIKANQSSGTPNDLYAVIQPLLTAAGGTAVIKNSGPACFILTLGIPTPVAQATLIASLIAQARLGGVQAETIFSPRVSSQVFRYDVGPGYDIGHYAGGLVS